MRRIGASIAAETERRLRGIHKAITLDGVNTDPYDILNEGDETPAAAATRQGNDAASAASLAGLAVLPLAIRPALNDLTFDSALQAFASTGSVVTDEVSAQLLQDAADYADGRSAALVDPGDDTGIVGSTRNMLAATIASGLAAGLSAADIADRIQDAYAFSWDSADAIGDYEASLANSTGAMAGYAAAAALGLGMQKGWNTAGDDKVEDICLGKETEGLIPLDQAFSSGDQATPAHNGCRCNVSVVLTTPPAS